MECMAAHSQQQADMGCTLAGLVVEVVGPLEQQVAHMVVQVVPPAVVANADPAGPHIHSLHITHSAEDCKQQLSAVVVVVELLQRLQPNKQNNLVELAGQEEVLGVKEVGGCKSAGERKDFCSSSSGNRESFRYHI